MNSIAHSLAPQPANVAVTVSPTRKLDAALSSLPLLLNSTWASEAILPAPYKARIEATIPMLREAIRPASGREFAVAIDDLLGWAEMFGVVSLPDEPGARVRKLQVIAERYRQDLADLPADLLVQAIKAVTSSAAYRVLPMPGDLRKAISGQMSARRVALSRLEIAMKIGRFEAPPVPPEERATAGQLAQLRRMLAGSVARLPGSETPEVGEPPAIRREESLRRDADEEARGAGWGVA